MAPSTKCVRSSAKDEIKQQEILQAIIIADNFNEKLHPVTISKPNVLLPVVNGVLLDYLLQSLEECGIQEAYIFCCSHNQEIRSYISSSKWSEDNSSMSVFVISSTTFLSMGDMIRDLDAKAFIRTDFILIRGDVIFNFPLQPILEEHKKRRQEDKGCALTLLYRRALPHHSLRCKEDDFVVAVEATSKKIRYYQRINNSKSFTIPLEVFQENEEVSIHYDLLDMHIAICSPCFPPLFSDNFDYQSLDDFVKGLLVNEELLGNSMYINVAERGYGASVSNFYMYNAVSQNMLSRWTYPLVPDILTINGSRYSHIRPNIYKAANVEIGRNCIIKEKVAIGDGAKIGEGCVISHTVIGDNCVIGKNVEIKGSYLWSNVTVGDNCKLDTCLLAENVILHSNVTIQPGCILGNEVVIGDNITLKEFTKFQSQAVIEQNDADFGDDPFSDQEKTDKLEEKICDANLVGTNGHGFLCQSPYESDEEDEELVVDIWGKLPDDSTFNEDTESSSSEILSPGDIVSEGSDGIGNDYDDDTALFYTEVLESLQRGIEEKVKSENLILEINSSKHAYNVTMKEVNTLLIKVILKMPLENLEKELSAQEYLSSVKKNLVFFHPLVVNYIRSAESQMDCLSSIEEFMKGNEKLSPAVIKVIHYWYDKDILNEAVILKWYENLSSENESVKKQASTFIKWLQEADEESSEDE